MEREKLKELVGDYMATQNEIERLREDSRSLLKDMADLMAPVKVGDVVQITGYSHKGKKMVVTHIWAEIKNWQKAMLYVTAHGDVLKKDGLPGLNTAENQYGFEI